MKARKGCILLATVKQFNAVCCMIASDLSLLHVPSDQQREEKKKVFSLRRIINNLFRCSQFRVLHFSSP